MNYIVNTKDMLLNAQKYNYAIPAFNIHNLETMQVVVETGAEMKSPVILAATPSTIDYAGADYLVSIAKTAANKYSIPIAVHLDHFTNVELIKNCIDVGFSSVMIDASKESYDNNIKIVKEVVDYAHKRGVTVEAELGKLIGIEDDITVSDREASYTQPDLAAEFVKKTEIDSLAIAIGTAHGLYHGEPKIDYERLIEIRKKVSVPLVLHGASGVPFEKVKKAIELGICKVNIATDLKIPFSNAVKKYLIENPHVNDPRKYLMPGKIAMKTVVIEKIKMCGSLNKA